MRRIFILGFLLLAFGPIALAEPDSSDAPREIVVLEVQAPPALAGAAARVRSLEPERIARLQGYVGLVRPGPPIRVTLEPIGSRLEQATPRRVAGLAYGSLGAIVLFPDRSPPYPYGSFDEVLLHEITHVLAARAAGFQRLPRWFSEGLAMVGAGTWGLDDRGWLTVAAVVGPDTPLADLESMFRAGGGRSSRAYALSGAFVRDLLERRGPGVVADILARRALGLEFDEAFRRTVGADPETAARAFRRRYSLWYRWVPLATSSLTLWLGITALALAAGWRKKRRRAALEAAWEAEEEPPPPTPPPTPPPGGWVH